MNTIDRIISFEPKYYPGKNPFLSVKVVAIVEDFVVVHHQTMEDPEELGPAECVAVFTVEEYNDDFVINEQSIRDLINEYSPEWKLSDYGEF